MTDQKGPHVELDVTNGNEIGQYRDDVFVGHYFVFAKRSGAFDLGSDRRSRLGLGPAPGGRAVVPLEGEVQLAGATLQRTESIGVSPLGCVVSDRDLYRAEEDVVNLFVALPGESEDAVLKVEADGSHMTSRDLELRGGVAIEQLAMLLPGEYEVRLEVDGRRVGEPVTFTVAEYTLAPLSGRLLSHQLDRGASELSFEIAVESYQVPVDEVLYIELLDDDRPVDSTTAEPATPGRFRGELGLTGEGPFRLRVAPEADRGRTAEIVVPGTRSHERELTVVSELGTEKLFSLMPEPSAVPLRGGFLTDGDHLATPLTVDEIVTDSPIVSVRADVSNLHAMVFDHVAGEERVERLGDFEAGAEVELDVDCDLCTVVFACWAGDRPLEAYATFVRPSELELQVDVPDAAAPGEEITVGISVEGAREERASILLCVRDERLTAADAPEMALASAWKASIGDVVSSMAESGFRSLDELMPLEPQFIAMSPPSSAGFGGAPDDDEDWPAQVLSSSRINASRPRGASGLIEGAARPAKGAVVDGIARLAQGLARDDGAADLGGEGASPRTDFAEVLFYGLVSVEDAEELVIPLADSTTTYVVEAFVLSGGDWTQTRETLVVDQDVRVDLELPASVHSDDDATGWVRVATASGRGRVTLFHDGREVDLQGPNDGIHPTPVEISFAVGPGEWEARVEDVESGESDSVQAFIDRPGSYRRRVKSLRLLRSGESLDLDSADALTMRVLPGLETSFDSLVNASASYRHLCCEQTAAKMFSATFMYLTADDERRRRKAEKIIVAGAAREKKMFRRGKGFRMYPLAQISEYYSKLTVRYLWKLGRLRDVDGLSTSLRRAVNDALELADAAADAHTMEPVPAEITSMEEAYATISNGGSSADAVGYVKRHLDDSGDDVRVRGARLLVAKRAALAYAAATLAASGDIGRALEVADHVTREFNEEGRLYSTVDSIAAVAMMVELKAAGVVDGAAGTVKVNGEERTPMEAARLDDQVETVEVIDGAAAVEVTRIVEERWDAYEGSFKVKVGFRDDADKRAKKFEAGHRYELLISLKEGYQNGDLVHVALPPSMAWLRGGGRVQSFTVDFEGEDEVRVPVIVTSEFEGEQHFAACVRNMFEEERASSPGLLTVKNKSGWFW